MVKDDEVSGAKKGEECGKLIFGDIPVHDGRSVRRQDRREPPAIPGSLARPPTTLTWMSSPDIVSRPTAAASPA